jgi:hypothetical protein
MKERKERKKIGVPCTLQSAMLVTKYTRTCNLLKIAGGKSSQRAGYRKETQKVSAEGERSNVLYCMYNTLQSGQFAKKERCTVQQRCRSARQHPVQNKFAGNGPRWRFRA